MGKKSIPLFWWNERILQNKEKENYGDLLSRYLVEKISGKSVKWVHPKKRSWWEKNQTNYLAAGSIIHHCTSRSIIWGSGIIDRKQAVEKADFRAVRGPETRNYLLETGYSCPEIYGDPGLLLPIFYETKPIKKYELGIIPHYHDFDLVLSLYGDAEDVLIIDLRTLDVEDVTYRFLQCEKVVSSSLHGLIISHAYGIPAIWIRFSNKLFGDNIKFVDYQKSVKMEEYEGILLQEKVVRGDFLKMFNSFPDLPSANVIEELQLGLLESCPFTPEI